MSDKRKADMSILLKKQGKTQKIELFSWHKFGEYEYRHTAPRYRIRVNGKWFHDGKIKYYTKWQVRDLIWRSYEFP